MKNMEFSKDNTGIKIILLGETGVGKTNLIAVATGQKFNPNSKANNVSVFSEGKYEAKDGSTYIYNLWDTAGQELYRSLNKIYIKESKIVLIVYAIDNKNSFDQIGYWIDYVKSLLKDGEYVLALVGNKIDLFESLDVIPDEEGQKAAKKYGIKLKLTSALTQAKTFKEFVHELIDDYIKLIGPQGISELEKKTIKINKTIAKKKTKKKCC